LETPNQNQRAAAAIRDRKTPIGVEVACDRIEHADRQVILGAQDCCGAGEMLRGHADNGEVLPVDSHGLLEDAAIESRSPPDLVADDDRARRSARAFVVHREVAAVDRVGCVKSMCVKEQPFLREKPCSCPSFPWRSNGSCSLSRFYSDPLTLKSSRLSCSAMS